MSSWTSWRVDTKPRGPPIMAAPDEAQAWSGSVGAFLALVLGTCSGVFEAARLRVSPHQTINMTVFVILTLKAPAGPDIGMASCIGKQSVCVVFGVYWMVSE